MQSISETAKNLCATMQDRPPHVIETRLSAKSKGSVETVFGRS
jgi:hypothetical protein